MHPRQLNFNDESVESGRPKNNEEQADCSDQHHQKGSQGEAESDYEDNDDNRFEVVKIKLNNAHSDKKSVPTHTVSVVSSNPPECLTNRTLGSRSAIEAPSEGQTQRDNKKSPHGQQNKNKWKSEVPTTIVSIKS